MISIVIPVYKISELLLRRSLNSVLSQGFSDIECIVIDDGSPDSCGKICDEYAALDLRFRVIHTENAGVSNARNIGIQNASGEYIIFMDGDDFFPFNDCVEKLFTFMEAAKCDLLFFKYFSLNAKEKNIPKVEWTGEIEDVDINDVIFRVISEQDTVLPYSYGAPWGKVIRTEIIKNNSVEFPLGIKKSQDRIFMTRLLSFTPCVKTVDYYGYVYIKDESSICNRYNPDIFKILTDAALILYESIIDYYSVEHHKKLLEAFCYFKRKCLFNCFKLYFFANDHQRTKRDIKYFIETCKEYEPYIQKCHSNLGISKKRRIIMTLLKLKWYYIAYFAEKILKA